MESVRVLSGRVITPDDEVIDLFSMAANLVGNLALGSALVKSGECAKVLLGDRGGVVGADESISIGGITDNDNLHGLLSNSVDSLPLCLENLSVGLEEVSSFHSGASWPGANQNSYIAVFEADVGVSAGDNVLDAAICSILELHDETLEDLLSRGQLNQLKDHLLVGAKHASLSDKVAKEGSDLTSGSGDSNTNSWLFQV